MNIFSVTAIAFAFILVTANDSFALHMGPPSCSLGFIIESSHVAYCPSARANHTKASGAVDGYANDFSFHLYHDSLMHYGPPAW